MRAKLTADQRRLTRLALAIQAKTVRLRNNAALVISEPFPGRNLTTFRRTCEEMRALCKELLDVTERKGADEA